MKGRQGYEKVEILLERTKDERRTDKSSLLFENISVPLSIQPLRVPNLQQYLK